MPCVIASKADLDPLKEAVEADPTIRISINLETMNVTSSAGHSVKVTMPESAREALISGRWDPIQELLDKSPSIEQKALQLGYV